MQLLSNYPGSKNGAGVHQQIINRIPAHEIYIEPFAGSAGIYRRKAPAVSSILIEIDQDQCAKLAILSTGSCTVKNADAVPELTALLSTLTDRHFIYLDPPYLHSTRKDLALYRHEMSEDQHHHLINSLLPQITATGARWMLSGYKNSMYDDAARAQGLFTHSFSSMTRRGPATETIWMNYDPELSSIAESTYAGSDFRERERIRRKAKRWAAKFAKLPHLEQQAILAMLQANKK